MDTFPYEGAAAQEWSSPPKRLSGELSELEYFMIHAPRSQAATHCTIRMWTGPDGSPPRDPVEIDWAEHTLADEVEALRLLVREQRSRSWRAILFHQPPSLSCSVM